jgi:NAD(P)-dependent dehydrogenase (short-subunit alcohol dehydrogenase family)
MNTLVLGANGPLGLACTRAVLISGASVVAAVQSPHRIPPALHDLREEFPAQLTSLAWDASAWPALPQVERAIVAELPIPPAQTDEADDPTADLRALTAARLQTDVRTLLAPTLAAIQLITHARPRRVLIQASWLGSIGEKIRGGGYALGAAYAAHLMLVRTAAIDLQRAGIATVIGNAGRYKLDMAGPDFHADVDVVARGLLAVLDACELQTEPEFRDWRGTVRSW